MSGRRGDEIGFPAADVTKGRDRPLAAENRLLAAKSGFKGLADFIRTTILDRALFNR